jgi:hypothetical protein
MHYSLVTWFLSICGSRSSASEVDIHHHIVLFIGQYYTQEGQFTFWFLLLIATTWFQHQNGYHSVCPYMSFGTICFLLLVFPFLYSYLSICVYFFMQSNDEYFIFFFLHSIYAWWRIICLDQVAMYAQQNFLMIFFEHPMFAMYKNSCLKMECYLKFRIWVLLFVLFNQHAYRVYLIDMLFIFEEIISLLHTCMLYFQTMWL